MRPSQPQIHSHAGPQRCPRRRSTGFSLIEIMVAISIIAVLVGLGIAGYTQAQNMAKRSRTQVVLKQALAAATEYQARTGTTIDESTAGHTGIGGVNHREIKRFVAAIQEVEASRQVLATLGDRLVKDTNDDHWMIIDGYGRPIRYYQRIPESHPDRLPPYPRPVFISAGPDGSFIVPSDSSQDDNLYSYELD